MPDADNRADHSLPETSRLLSIVARLRGKDGCPWDREQTLESLKPYLIEECCELLDAVDSANPDLHREELGDVLLQVALQSQIQSEAGRFAFEDVARVLADKLVRRHPHVFGDVQVANSQDVVRNWDAIKATEKKDAPPASVLDGLPQMLPALQRAQRIQARAAKAKFDWPDEHGVIAKLDEELDELREALAGGDASRVEAEVGDVMFTLVNLCRFRRIQAEEALRKTVATFTRRFQSVEAQARAAGTRVADLSPDEMNRYWDAAKAAE